ncbi:MAG TPA: hypothetical protein VFX59_14600 [Polyangiales bacterium]|nr:hypothetical protein [Polyangiales bacterium]
MRALLPLALSLAWSAPALACSPQPVLRPYVGKQVAQGAVVGFAECSVDCSRLRVSVTDSEGVAVPGEVGNDGAHYYWKPTQTLTLGQSYTLVGETAGLVAQGSLGGTFEVVARVEPALESVGFSVGARLVDTGKACCTSSPPPPGACVPTCTVTSRRGQVRAAVSVRGAEALSSQYTFWATISDGTYEHRSPLRAFDGFALEQEQTTLQGRYCLRVEAVALAGEQSVLVHEECKDVDLQLPEGWTATPESIASFQANCGPRDAGAKRDAAVVDAGVAIADASALGAERDAAEPYEGPPSAGGCQLREDHAGTLTTVLILLGLAASGSRRASRRARMPRRHEREDA